QVHGVVDGGLLQVRRQVRQHAPGEEVRRRRRVGGVEVRHRARRQDAVDALVVVQGEAELLQVIGAAHACGGLAHLLHGGEQEADEDGDDRYHHQQLDQREAATTSRSHEEPPRRNDICPNVLVSWCRGGNLLALVWLPFFTEGRMEATRVSNP